MKIKKIASLGLGVLVCLTVGCVCGCKQSDGKGSDSSIAGAVDMFPKTLALKVGGTYQLQAMDLRTNEYSFTTSDSQICSVSETGLVRALAVGEATVSATKGDVSYACRLVVSPTDAVEDEPNYTVEVVTTTESLIGTESALQAVVYKNGELCNENVVWSVPENTTISYTVDGNRLSFQGRSKGIVAVSYKIGNYTGVSKIKVYEESDYLPEVNTTITQTGAFWTAVDGAEGYKYTVTNGASWIDVSKDTLNVSYGKEVNPLNVSVKAVAVFESEKVDSKYSFLNDIDCSETDVLGAMQECDESAAVNDGVYETTPTAKGDFSKIVGNIYGTSTAILGDSVNAYTNTAFVMDIKAKAGSKVYFVSKSETNEINVSEFSVGAEWITVGYTLNAYPEFCRLEASGAISVKNVRLIKNCEEFAYSTTYAMIKEVTENLDGAEKEDVFEAANKMKFLSPAERIDLTEKTLKALDEKYFELYPEYTATALGEILTPDMLTMDVGAFDYYTVEKDGVKVRILFTTKTMTSARMLMDWQEFDEADMIIVEWYNAQNTTLKFFQDEGFVEKGWQISSIKATDYNVKGSFAYSNGYFGIYRIQVVKCPAPTAFGQTITADMFKQTQSYNGEISEAIPRTAIVKKDGTYVSVFKSVKIGISVVAQSDLMDLLPAEAKDTDQVTAEIYFYGASGFIFAGKTYGLCEAGRWYTFTCTVAEWKAKPSLYSNLLIGIGSFELVKTKLPQAFGQEISDTSYFTYVKDNQTYNATLGQIEKGGEQVGIIRNCAGVGLAATEKFNALIPSTAKDTDNIVVDVYFYGVSDFIFAGTTTTGYQAGNWYTFKCSVADWKKTSRLYSNCEVGVANFRIESVKLLQAFGQEVTFTDIYSGMTLIEKDGEAVLEGKTEVTCKATDRFKELLPSTAKDTDQISFKILLTNRFTSVYGENKGNQWATNQWIDVTITVAQFKDGGVYTFGTFYLKGFTYTAV